MTIQASRDLAAELLMAVEREHELNSRIDVLSSKVANLEGKVNHHREKTTNYKAALKQIVEQAAPCGWGGCKRSRVVPMCVQCLAKEALGE